jgi:nicotinamide-nucleotide amidase
VKAEIISIGTELLLGEITDTDASYLAGQLPALGIDLRWISQVGDNKTRLIEVLERAWRRSDLILTTGGLGPTEDDMTREAIAVMLGEKPEIEPLLEEGLRKRYTQLGVEMPASNLKQATVIASAEAIINERGTAPGWWINRDSRILIAMPGPPAELHEMWQKRVRPRLQKTSTDFIISRTLKTFGLSEAEVGEIVSPLAFSDNPALGIYAKADGIQLRITARAESKEEAEYSIAESERKIRALLDEYIWGTDDDSLEIIVGNLLKEKKLSLAIMEDYSGGWLTAGMANLPDSQVFFKGGMVAKSETAKIAFGVNPDILSKFGAVSPEAAQAMAEAVRRLLKADIGVGITGLEESEENPMGIIYIGMDDGKNSKVIHRPQGKRRITATVLSELRKLLLSKS